MVRSKLLIGIFAAACLAACGGSGSGGGPTGVTPPPGGTGGNNPPPTTNQVTLGDATFTPSDIAVPVGTTVTWSWPSCDPSGGYGGYGGYGTCVTHDILFDDGTTSGTQSSGTFTRTFGTAGTFNYHCTIHGTAMAGQVKVS